MDTSVITEWRHVRGLVLVASNQQFVLCTMHNSLASTCSSVHFFPVAGGSFPIPLTPKLKHTLHVFVVVVCRRRRCLSCCSSLLLHVLPLLEIVAVPTTIHSVPRNCYYCYCCCYCYCYCYCYCFAIAIVIVTNWRIRLWRWEGFIFIFILLLLFKKTRRCWLFFWGDAGSFLGSLIFFHSHSIGVESQKIK